MQFEHALLSRRKLLLSSLTACMAEDALATSIVLPAPTSLPDDLSQALIKGSPLLVMVSLKGCPFCKIARENYLVPMLHEQNLSIDQVDMRSRQLVKNFNGIKLTHDELIQSWGVKITPTVLFFGRGGVEVAERLAGASIPDFYGAYLDDRVRMARSAIGI